MNQNFIAYYSHSGNTRRVAELIQEVTGGTLFEIEPADEYPASYNTVVEQVKKKSGPESVRHSRRCPMFLSTTRLSLVAPTGGAPPVMTFLEGLDLSTKNVAFFCTHGGSGQAHVLKDMAAACPKSKLLPGFDLLGAGSGDTQDRILAWLSKLNLQNERRN